jgi:hypothetical protein
MRLCVQRVKRFSGLAKHWPIESISRQGKHRCADLSKVSIAFQVKAALARVGPEVIPGARAGHGRAWRSLSSPP